MKKVLLALLAFFSITVNAQDILVLNDGTSMKVFNMDVSPSDKIYYQLSEVDTAQVRRVSKSDVLIIKKTDGTKIDPNASAEAPAAASAPVDGVVASDRFPEIDIENFHGFLLAKGNCVYIPTDSNVDYEQAGQKQLKKRIETIGYWTVVDRIEQAHFVLQFWASTNGPDGGWVHMRTREGYTNYPTCSWDHIWGKITAPFSVLFGWSPSGETAAENIKAADFIVDKRWYTKRGWEKTLTDEKFPSKQLLKTFTEQKFMIP